MSKVIIVVDEGGVCDNVVCVAVCDVSTGCSQCFANFADTFLLKICAKYNSSKKT